MSIVKNVKVEGKKVLTNDDLRNKGINGKDAKIAMYDAKEQELALLKAKLAETEAALLRATTKGKAFSSVKYLFSLLPSRINPKGLLPDLQEIDALALRDQVLAEQKRLGVDKEYKLISVRTDYRFFSMVLDAITPYYCLVPIPQPQDKVTDDQGNLVSPVEEVPTVTVS